MSTTTDTTIEETVTKLAALLEQIETRLPRTPIVKIVSPTTVHLRRAPLLRRRFD